MAASTIGQHVTIEELRERFELREVEGETWVVYKEGPFQRGRRKAGDRAGSEIHFKHSTTTYRMVGVQSAAGKRLQPFEHILVWGLHHGQWPTAPIDHRDGNGLNNSPDNLRLATPSQNNCNKAAARKNKLGFKGVERVKNLGPDTFRVTVSYTPQGGKRKVRRKNFPTPEAAYEWRNATAVDMHGEFARI